ncbi:MAG: gfo/Idh/MocA family oxidoreductase [Acidobacteria bacterium]|nr:MAG: gfo/Idh/MocA family oxidoreductase [Acidobacteriota bacterium]
MEDHLNRRRFVGKTVGGVVVSAASYRRILGANDRIRVANIGCGGRGLLKEALEVRERTNVDIVAICDTWRPRREEAVAAVRDAGGQPPKDYVHYQDVLALKDVDAVIIGTPDHQHCTQLAAAAQAGKDAYVEKPLAMTMEELQKAVEAVKRNNRVVQIGTQVRSWPAPAAAAAFIKSGGLGKILKIEQSRNGYRPYWHGTGNREVKEADVDWNAFLMHAKYRPFDPDQYAAWYGYREFSRGPQTNLMVHFIDLVHYFTGAPYPLRGVGFAGTYRWKDKRTAPDSVEIVLEYPEQGFLTRYSTVFGNSGNSFMKVIGTRGILDITNWRGEIKLIGEGSGEPDKLDPGTTVPPVQPEHHMADFFNCIRTRKSPLAPLDAGWGHSIATLMADLSIQTGKRMIYDPAKKEIREG